MVLFNYATKEITMKVVYYGPGLCGKTTNLQFIHSRLNPKTRGKLISLATEADRTLFFDFLPMEMGTIKGFKIRFQLYTVPGQVRYNATRKLVLKGSDGVVFVADSQRAMMDQNIESIENLKENLLSNGLDPNEIPLVLQFNKRDIKDISPVSELYERINYRGVPYFESIATMGDGVLETFKEITRILLKKMSEKHSMEFKDEILPAEVTVKGEVEDIKKPMIEAIHPTIEIEEGITQEITPEVLEFAAEEEIETAEYFSTAEDVVAVEEVISQGEKYPIELEIPSSEEPSVIEEEPSVIGSEATMEEAVEKKPLKYAPHVTEEEILDLLKGIKDGLNSLSDFLFEIKRTQEGLNRSIVENEETHKRKTEEILKSLSDIKGKVESLRERP